MQILLPIYTAKVIESNWAFYFKDDLDNKSHMPRDVDLHNKSTIFTMPILPPPLVDRCDIVENQFKVDE